MSYELINNIKEEITPNAKNNQGKKLCIITHDILTTNNTIKIEGVLYSMRGLRDWLKTEVKKRFMVIISDLLYDLDGIPITLSNDTINGVNYDNIMQVDFIRLFNVRSPYTNLYYNNQIKARLFEVFIKNSKKNSIYEFIQK